MTRSMYSSALLVLIFAIVFPTDAAAHDAKHATESTMSNAIETQHVVVTPVFQHDIPNISGKTIRAVTVDYQPGGKSMPHRHGSAYIVAYVLSGAIRSQVDDAKIQVFKAGEHWIENPGAHHVVSENASATEPASLLAIFITNAGDERLVTFDQ